MVNTNDLNSIKENSFPILHIFSWLQKRVCTEDHGGSILDGGAEQRGALDTDSRSNQKRRAVVILIGAPGAALFVLAVDVAEEQHKAEKNAQNKVATDKDMLECYSQGDAGMRNMESAITITDLLWRIT